MSCFTAPTMPRRLQPELFCAGPLWQRLLQELRARGHYGKRESGAFLLGIRTEPLARVEDFIPYDELDPHSLDTGIVHFDGRHYGALWERCRRTQYAVVADVHTHPFGSGQSPSDQAHPMISAAGHIALIIPRFAMGEPPLHEIGMYRYLGAKRWHTIAPGARHAFLQIGQTGVQA
jgi:hypothetical protein